MTLSPEMRAKMIEDMARAIMGDQLWPGAYDKSDQYQGQSAEAIAWKQHATAALDALLPHIKALVEAETEQAVEAERERFEGICEEEERKYRVTSYARTALMTVAAAIRGEG